ncbi:MAG: hypothetical protein HC918_01860 [Oscillatoriales cyanobacterium SM2_1_8]|nr:hypothetical protein [Oscillatoriales cyanobacterium SM2_1_8]
MWVGAIAWLVGYAWLTRNLFMDDAWTGLTYARNLWAGAGYVFFPGQPPVEGTTNLLWTLALVPLGDCRWRPRFWGWFASGEPSP